MIASFPYRSRTYSHVPAQPQAIEASRYTPIGGGLGSFANSTATAVAPRIAEQACTSMSMTEDYSNG